MYGETDGLGRKAVTNVATHHNVQATLLHLLGAYPRQLGFMWLTSTGSLIDVGPSEQPA